MARVQWAGYSDLDARDLLDRNDEEPMTEAMHWVEDYLTQQGRARSREVKDMGKKEGFSQSAIERAARKLKVVSVSENFPRQTIWSLPGLPATAPPWALT